MTNNKFSVLPIEDDIVSSRRSENLSEIRKYYKDSVANRMKVFDKYPDLYHCIYYLEFSEYDNSGYITEVVMPTIDALRTFESLDDREIIFNFGDTLDMFKNSIYIVFNEVDYVLNKYKILLC